MAFQQLKGPSDQEIREILNSIPIEDTVKYCSKLKLGEAYFQIAVDRGLFQNRTPDEILWDACRAGSLIHATNAIELHADVNCHNENHYAPLTLAVKVGNLDLVEYLIGQGANSNIRNYRDESLLFEMGDHETCKYLLGLGLDVNHQSSEGNTPLMKQTDNVEVAELLIQANANPLLRNHEGLNTVDIAIYRKDFEVASFIINQILQNAGGNAAQEIIELFSKASEALNDKLDADH